MKLLFDQNISFRIVKNLRKEYPDTSHVIHENLLNASDFDIWKYAKENGFAIVTFDADFYDLATLKGHPPKVVWLRTGNTSTSNLERVIKMNLDAISDFLTSETFKNVSCLEIV